MDYPITIERDAAGRVRVGFPDFPGTHAAGADEAEWRLHAQAALASAVEKHIRERRAVPAPSPVTTDYVTVPALIEVKIRLYDAMRAANIGKAELARRLHWHMPQVDRLFDVQHGSRLEQLEAAFAALGKRLIVDVQDEGLTVDSGRHGSRSKPARPVHTVPATPAFEVQWD